MRTCWVTTDAIPGVVVTVSVATADPRVVAEIERAAELNGISLERRRGHDGAGARAMSSLRGPEAEGVVWLLGRLIADHPDGGAAVRGSGIWVIVTPDVGDRRYAVLRSTGAVYELDPDGSVPDDPIFTPA